MLKRRLINTTIEVGDASIPLKIYFERRAGVRYYLGRSGGIIRLPLAFTINQQGEELQKFKVWIATRVSKRKPLNDHFNKKTLNDGDKLSIGGKDYLIQKNFHDKPQFTARLRDGVISLYLFEKAIAAEQIQAQKKLLSKLVAKDQLPAIEERVRQLNARHFNKPVNKVTLKYNLSNWGSCSTKGNINLSTCLLFARPDVIDYVIIHELAHLVEMNHSPHFWKLVENAMPDYREKIKWLKKNWGTCDF